MAEKLKLSEYAKLATSFAENPSDENYKSIQDFLNKIQVKEYMPLKNKEIVMVDILRAIHRDYDAPGSAGFLEIGKIEKGLFGYCLNLENDLGIIGNSFVAYDLYYQHGLVDYIVSKCEKDYNRLCHMVDNSIQFSNIYRLLESAEAMNNENYEDWIKTMQDVKDTLSSENLKGLVNIVTSEDESGQELLRTIQQEALNEIESEDKYEHEKFKEAIKDLSK